MAATAEMLFELAPCGLVHGSDALRKAVRRVLSSGESLAADDVPGALPAVMIAPSRRAGRRAPAVERSGYHELRSPISAIVLQAGMLVRSVSRDDALLRRAARLEAVARRTARLVESLLEVAQIRRRDVSLALEELDLAALVRDALAELQPAFRRTRSETSLSAPEPVIGRWNRVLLESVVTNLLANAAKFGAGAPVEIRVIAAGSLARLQIRDHGAGIAPEALDGIFERYGRGGLPSPPVTRS